jgi:hypothetical protein
MKVGKLRYPLQSKFSDPVCQNELHFYLSGDSEGGGTSFHEQDFDF